ADQRGSAPAQEGVQPPGPLYPEAVRGGLLQIVEQLGPLLVVRGQDADAATAGVLPHRVDVDALEALGPACDRVLGPARRRSALGVRGLARDLAAQRPQQPGRVLAAG